MRAPLTKFIRSPEMLTLSGRSIQFASQLALVLILPKVLAPALYAEFNLLIPLAALGVTFAFGWLTSAFHRHVYEVLDPRDSRFRQTVFIYYGSMSLILVAIFFVASALTDSNYRILPLLLLAMGLRDSVVGALNMSSNHKGFFLANLGFATSLTAFIGLCAMSEHNNLATYLIIYSVLDSVFALTAMNWIGVVTLRTAPRYDTNVAMRYFRYGLPIVLRGLPLWVMSVSDRYLLALWMPAESVAAYILSYQHGGSIIMIPMSFVMSIIFPRILRIDKEKGAEAALGYAYKMLGYYLRFLPLFVMPACAVVLAIRYYLYPEYQFTPAVIVIIVFAHVIQGMTHFYNKEFELNGRTMTITKAVGTGAVLNVSMNLVLIPAFGEHGQLAAAISTLVAYSVTVYLLYRFRTHRPDAIQ